MTLGEKEQEFLAALRVSNYDNKRLTCLQCMQTQPSAAVVSHFTLFIKAAYSSHLLAGILL